MQQNVASSPFGGYAERPQMGLDVEFGADPASGAAFFQSDGRKHDDLKQMLDSNKDGLKLEAMKRIIGMIARGRDASDLFPAVVKNVVSKNIEVKKLVYVYLVRYAEEQQDLALLSISTFQRALKDSNQLIRASALRVLSSIRVNMIVPIVMLAIRDSATDLSPYVRKTAAHAIPKLYSLDSDQKDELVTVIEKLLSDRTTLVVGSAVMAFDEVCPERVDLIHKNYRKLCNLLVDVDEWGQVIIINMLTRYARTQFVDPNCDDDMLMDDDDYDDDRDDRDGLAGGDSKRYYGNAHNNANDNNDNEASSASSSASSSSSSSSSSSASTSASANATACTGAKKKQKKNKKNNNNSKSRKSKSNPPKKQEPKRSLSPNNSYHVDLDHRLLLRQTKPLLQSRNASVVMAVAQLYHHVAPRNEVQLIAKALIRLLRSHKEVQSVVLTCIASMSAKRKSIFEPYIKSFFVRTIDPTHLKLLKLDILTNLATATSIALILREFQTYISSNDHTFVAATIQAIGRCAASIKEVTETCLNGLVHLLSNHEEHVVAESVVVIKKLLQTKAAEHYEIISQMAKLIDYITVPAARASIIWLIGEYNEKVPKIAPDVLRKMAKTFIDEEDVVKLQVLNLGVKLYLTNAAQTSLLCQYVFSLARYDINYDVRDRARFLRQFIFPASGHSTVLTAQARKIFLTSKPPPVPENKYHDTNIFQLGSLSHYLNMQATGYKELPAFPTEPSDPSVRNIEGYMHEPSVKSTSSAGKDNAKTKSKAKGKSGAGAGAGAAAIDGGSEKTQAKKPAKNFLSESEDKSSAYSSTSSSGESTTESSSSESRAASSANLKMQRKKQQQQQQQKSQAFAIAAQINNLPDKNAALATPPARNNYNASNVGTSDSEASSSYTSSNSDTGASGSGTGRGGSGNSGSSSESSSDGAATNSNSHSGNENSVDNAAPKSANSENEKEPPKPKHKERLKIKIRAKAKRPMALPVQAQGQAKSNLDLLLDLDDIPPIGPVMTPSLGGFLTPATPTLPRNLTLTPQHIDYRIELVGPSYIDFNFKELLNKITGRGLQLNYRYTRAPHLYSSSMISVELQFINYSKEDICKITMSKNRTLPIGMYINDFAPIPKLQPQQTVTCILGIDFNDSTHSIDFDITTSNKGISSVTLKPKIGELVRSVQISESYFKDERTKLRGMNEHKCQLTLLNDANCDLSAVLKQKTCECVNVASIKTPPGGFKPFEHCFSGQTLNSKSLVLVALNWANKDDDSNIVLMVSVNCEKMVIGSMILNELRNALQPLTVKN